MDEARRNLPAEESREAPGTPRTMIIGDIHGCQTALQALLEKLRPDEKLDRLILLGDLFDRGPDSWEVFRTVRGLADRFSSRFILLRGNHEDYLLQEKLTLAQRLLWNRVGRGATEKSFRAHGERMEDAAPWLAKHCRLWWKGEGAPQCVHAGLLIDPPEMNDRQTLLHDHDIVLRNQYAGPLTVVGHIALEQCTWFAGDGERAEALPEGTWAPLPERGVICIDTGCGKGGRLSAMVVRGRLYQLVSVTGG